MVLDDSIDNLWRNRDFRLYFCAVFMATLANQIQSVAVAWQIYAIARSPLALGYVGLAQFLPIAALFFVAGDIADRYNRRRILAISYVVQALATASLLVLTLLSAKSQWPFYAVLVLLGSARAFGQPAGQSFLPQLVSGERFPQAVAWTSSARQTAVIFGPALGGFIYIWGPATAYAVCLSLFVATSIAIGVLRPDSHTRPHDPAVGSVRRVTAGIRFIRSNPILLGAISRFVRGAAGRRHRAAADLCTRYPAGWTGRPRSASQCAGDWCGADWYVPRPGPFAPQRRLGNVCLYRNLWRGDDYVRALDRFHQINRSAHDARCFGYGQRVRADYLDPACDAGRDARAGSAVNSLFIGASNELGEFESGVTAAWFGTVPSVVTGGAGTVLVVVLWMMLFPGLRHLDKLSDLQVEGARTAD